MKTKLYILGLLTLLWGCETSTTRESKRHKDLLWSRQKLVAECTGADNVYDSIKDIAQRHPVDFKYFDNLIVVSAYFMADACGEYKQNIRIENDTIFLLFRHESDLSCSTAVYYKVDYLINNQQRKRYKILTKNNSHD